MRMDEEDIQVVGIVCPVIKIIESPLLVRVMGILCKRIVIESKAGYRAASFTVRVVPSERLSRMMFIPCCRRDT